MAAEADKPDPQSLKPVHYDTVLAEWLRAIDAFQTYYTQLAPYLSTEQKTPALSLNTGQCPPAQIRNLVLRMQTMLETLVEDMDSVNTMATTPGRCKTKKLVRHTRVLNSVNQQAQVVTYLIKQITM